MGDRLVRIALFAVLAFVGISRYCASPAETWETSLTRPPQGCAVKPEEIWVRFAKTRKNWVRSAKIN
jgi:hypothetical protein